MSLKAELDAFRSEFMAQVPPEIREAMVRADMELAASGIAQRAVKAGDRAPDFNLPDARGGHVRLKDLLTTGPVVLSFYRGGWCPYCNLELRALQHILPEITRLDAKLVIARLPVVALLLRRRELIGKVLLVLLRFAEFSLADAAAGHRRGDAQHEGHHASHANLLQKRFALPTLEGDAAL